MGRISIAVYGNQGNSFSNAWDAWDSIIHPRKGYIGRVHEAADAGFALVRQPSFVFMDTTFTIPENDRLDKTLAVVEGPATVDTLRQVYLDLLNEQLRPQGSEVLILDVSGQKKQTGWLRNFGGFGIVLLPNWALLLLAAYGSIQVLRNKAPLLHGAVAGMAGYTFLHKLQNEQKA